MLTNLSELLGKELLVEYNPAPAILIEDAILSNSANQLSSNGALVIQTGKFTGRAAEDKYVVEDDFTNRVIDWKNHIRKMELNTFSALKNEIVNHYKSHKKIYNINCSAGADPAYTLAIKVLTPSPAHAMFCQNIFREKKDTHPLGSFTILHAPKLEIVAQKFNLHSPTVIAINFTTHEIIIIGTEYAGEIKKSIFSVMNTILPELGILPMHTGSNANKSGQTSLFFGLSGTGKTTLSTDMDVDLIGDDEHGLSDKGIFNFEGGCYAKTYNLKYETEPEIFLASNQFLSLLENVVLDTETREPQFDNKSITENGRSTYKLSSLKNVVPSGLGAIPTNIFFLSADALGVLPPLSKLTTDQAMFYFLSGYTAKLAGTEIGLKGITSTFSHCFGAPFMMRHPKDYGNILKQFLEKHKINVWLVNTGWYGGLCGEGKRYSLKFTRSCIRKVQAGLPDDTTYLNDPVFSLAIPTRLDIEDSALLNPMDSWDDKNYYLKVATDLKKQFEDNYQKHL